MKTLPIEDPQLEIKTQEIYKAFEDARITNDHFTMRKSLSEHILLWKEDISEKISGHIILFYAENIFENVIPLLRAKTKKPIFYYTESKPDDRWFRLASKTSNIFFVQGDIFDLTHLRNSGIQKTYHVCIFNSLPLSMVESNTPECLLLANLIDDYFNVPYTIEINDNNEIRFLANKPKKYIANLGFHFYPKYIAGDLYVLNILDSLISYSANNSNILDVFIHMFVYNENHQQQKYKDEECEIQNQNIHITENLQIKTIKCPGIYNNKKYSDLLFDFCCLKPSIIPIGLITDRYTTSKKDRSPIMKKKNHNISVNYFNVLDVEMDQNFLPSQLTLTNPLPTTILSENDRIIIIGNNQIESEDLNNLLMKKDAETIGEENSGKSNESLIMEHLQESDNDLNNKKLLELMDLTLSGKKKITKKIEEKNNMIKNLIEEIERKKHGYEKFLEWDKEK